MRSMKFMTNFGIILFAGIMMGCTGAPLPQSQPQPASQSGKKKIPEITFKNLSPPYEAYDYFQGSKGYVFRFNATTFSLINAWWLAESSTLVYADEDFVKPRFSEAKLREVHFLDSQSTQCYVANNDKFAIVAFRGSEIWKKREKIDLNAMFADLKTNIDIRLTDWEKGGKVHRGFKEALDQVWPDLLPYIENLHHKGCKIWMTGHSLGAALATLAASRFGNVQGVYTFGSPRVGDEVFRERLKIRIYRIVNNDDIVPRVPPSGAYVHVGELKFIDSHGIIQNAMNGNEPLIKESRDETYGQGDSGQPKKKLFNGFVPDAFRDHVPLLYAIHLWNNIIESRQY